MIGCSLLCCFMDIVSRCVTAIMSAFTKKGEDKENERTSSEEKQLAFVDIAAGNHCSSLLKPN
ncbi:hypothetical protein DVH24_016742 [Malus domestica]|uniref:Uncharacterized protein n=1 Tax=Malus domestica TaxID=3750 RepID=A0A498HT47_MALDO|nr:hypothetical protein DVH24_016742 [Malus domestica]